MNINDYIEKVNNFLNDGKIYQKIIDKRRNLILSIEKFFNKFFLQIKDQLVLYDSDKKQLELKFYYKFYSIDFILVLFYGFFKIYKDNVLLRLIMSVIGFFIYELFKYFVNILLLF